MSIKLYEVRVTGIKRVVHIFASLVPFLNKAFAPSLEEFGKKVLENAKGRAAMFVRTGYLMESLTMRMEEDSVVIGPTADYGPFVSFGTKAHWIGANIEVAPFTWRFIGMHPGTVPNPYLEDAFNEELQGLPTILNNFVMVSLNELDEESKGYDEGESP